MEEVLDGKELRPTVLKSGLVNGLAVTVNGGVLLPLESVAYPGTGKITINRVLFGKCDARIDWSSNELYS